MLQTFDEDSELCCNHALTEAAEADPELSVIVYTNPKEISCHGLTK
jgi:hypothetical protein